MCLLELNNTHEGREVALATRFWKKEIGESYIVVGVVYNCFLITQKCTGTVLFWRGKVSELYFKLIVVSLKGKVY